MGESSRDMCSALETAQEFAVIKPQETTRNYGVAKRAGVATCREVKRLSRE